MCILWVCGVRLHYAHAWRSQTIEVRSRLVDAALEIGLNIWFIVKTIVFQHLMCHRGIIEAHRGLPRYESDMVSPTPHIPSRLHRGPPRYGPQQLFLVKTSHMQSRLIEAGLDTSLDSFFIKKKGFLNISCAIEAPSKLLEARLDTSLASLSIVKTMKTR